MSKSLNEWKGIGNITKDIEMRYSGSGVAVANFSVACNDSYKNKDTGEQVEATEFVNIVAFGKLAEIMGEYLSKGSKVYISGKFKTSKYQKDGQTHYGVKIEAKDMLMLDSRASDQTAKPQQESAPSAAAPNNDDFDDQNIPF